MSVTENEVKLSETLLRENNQSNSKAVGMNIENFLASHIKNPCDTQQNMIARDEKNLRSTSSVNQESMKNSKW